ncbi:MAG TPA: serine/threonine-protein kinase [Victivallales bacterium]|nr:serine/threonine-protein kinase [Victivallales bacterium]
MKNYQCTHCRNFFQAESGDHDKTLPCPHCGELLVIPSTVLPPGTTLGGFKIVSIIGEGGMGNIYLAEQISMGRKVALKVLSKEYSSDKDIINQFRKEVQLSGRLNHPYIVRAIDAGEEADYYYMAITYVEGEDYEKILSREKKIPEQEALNIIIKIADILSYAWEKHNLIHRDVKPGNIMRNKKGEIFLMDLGIAQSFDLRKKQSQDEHILGSPFYMSPEQAQGFHLDWRTDLYSLGATLYHMATGFPPYDAEKVETIVEMHISAPFPDPNKLNPPANLSTSTIKLLKKMLEKKPEDRFESWQDFISSAKKVAAELSGAPAKRSLKKIQGKPISQSLPQSTPLSLIHIIVFLISLVAFSFVAYKFFQMNKNSRALKALRKAENYLAKSSNDYEGALPLFEEAAALSRNTPHFDTALRRFKEVKSAVESKEERIKYFDKKFFEAQQKIAEKSYQQAIEILEGIKDIDDPARSKNANDIISQLKKRIK